MGGGGGAVAVTTRVAVSETTLPETSCRLYVSAIGNGVTRVTVNTPAASVGPQFEFSRTGVRVYRARDPWVGSARG